MDEEKSIALDAVHKEAVDLENIPLEEVFEHLKCTKEGLSSDGVQERLEMFGYNKLEEKKESKILKFLGFMWNPLSWVMEAAAIMAIGLAHGGGKSADYQDFFGIVILLIINSTISFIEENNAGNAAAALMARLAPKAKVLRDGRWSEEDAAVLVPGDIISIKLGDIIPADARLLHGDPLKIDQTAFTTQKDFGREAREAAWAAEQRTLHGLQSSEQKRFTERSTFRDINLMAEEAKRRAEITRLRELHTLKGKVESFAKLRGLDIDAMNQHYTV